MVWGVLLLSLVPTFCVGKSLEAGSTPLSFVERVTPAYITANCTGLSTKPLNSAGLAPASCSKDQ